MLRILNEPAGYLRDLGAQAVRGWSRFFFTPADPTAVGVIRLLVGALLFWDLAVLGLDLHEYLGSDGWIGPEAVRAYLAQNQPYAWSFWLSVPDRWLTAVWAGCLAVTALFALGVGSRVTAVLAWAIAVSTVRRAPLALFGFDHMIATWAFYLAAFGASGQAVSVDRVIARFRSRRAGLADPGGAPTRSVSANLTLRTLQLQLVLIYGSAGLSKLMGTEWWDGRAMEMLILTPEFRRFNLTWLLAYPTLLSLATHAGLLFEVSYPVLIWFPKFRPLLIAGAALMHFGIDLLLGLTEFGLAMFAANLAFASGGWLRSTVSGTRQPYGHLTFDGSAPRARSLANLIALADPDRVVRVEVDPAGASRDGLTLVGPGGRTHRGADALLRAARWLPLLWPVGLLGAVPGLGSLLRRVVGNWLRGGPTAARTSALPADGARRADKRGDEGPAARPKRAQRPARSEH